ncbi:hypothetical protein B0T21DRAFT_351134 [Apiosordaria backusii]|uniref:Uncharacterized protein n=1 Tax=Apiosordaria backusii TaxID=314023 RepID=A0AA40AXV9_9PEZI|nr:hypothetical protein B0T21DRAFT_351134 [Apiosordaria backusii]
MPATDITQIPKAMPITPDTNKLANVMPTTSQINQRNNALSTAENNEGAADFKSMPIAVALEKWSVLRPQSTPIAKPIRKKKTTRTTRNSILTAETTPYVVENPFPEGAPGLAASRRAPWDQKAPGPASRNSILTAETTPYIVENPFPEGALGLAASRWAPWNRV